MNFTFDKVSAKNRHLNVYFFGKYSTGKSYNAFGAPGPVGIIEVEPGADAEADTYPGLLKLNYPEGKLTEYLVGFCQAASKGLASPTPGKNFESVVLDSWSAFEDWYIQTKGIDVKLASSDAKLQRQLNDIKKELQGKILEPAFGGRLKNCHRIVTARQKNRWVGRETQGFIPDATLNFPHYFDMGFHCETDESGNKFRLTVHKTRFREIFPVGRIITLAPGQNIWKELSVVLNPNEVQVDDVTTAEILELWNQAGQPNGTIHDWLIAQTYIAQKGDKLDREDRIAARDDLKKLIDADADTKEQAA